MTRSITVFGAGIVGLCCASYLQRDGHQVTIVDRGEPGEATSFGNAGILSPGSCVPMAVPGVLKKLPGWLADPLGPLTLRPGHLPSMFPWFLHFLKASRPERVEAGADALHRMLVQTFDAYAPLLKAAGVEDIVRRPGYLVVYESDAAFQSDQLAWRLRRDRGVEFDVLDGPGLRRLEPALGPQYVRGTYILDQGYVASPLRLSQALASRFLANGGRIERREVLDVEIGPDGPTALLTDGGRMPFETLVLAAGVHSGKFAERLGERVLLEAERGYHVQFADPGIELSRPIMAAERKFFATPMEMGVRIAGTTEFAGLDRPANMGRARVLLENAKRLFPGIRTEAYSDWMGQRPSTPDYIPIVSASTRYPNVFHAFGHGHLGLVGGAPSGRIIADLVAGRKPAIDISPYRIDRF